MDVKKVLNEIIEKSNTEHEGELTLKLSYVEAKCLNDYLAQRLPSDILLADAMENDTSGKIIKVFVAYVLSAVVERLYDEHEKVWPEEHE